MAGLFVKGYIVDEELLENSNNRFVSITDRFTGSIFFVSLSFHITLDIFATHRTMIVVMLLAGVVGN